MRSIVSFTGSTVAALAVLMAAAQVGPAEAKLKCKDINGRWQICGDAKPFSKLTVGVGIRFNEKKPGLAANPPPAHPPTPGAATPYAGGITGVHTRR